MHVGFLCVCEFVCYFLFLNLQTSTPDRKWIIRREPWCSSEHCTSHSHADNPS